MLKNVSNKEQEKLLENVPWCCKKFYKLELAATKEMGLNLLKKWGRDPGKHFISFDSLLSSLLVVMEMSGVKVSGDLVENFYGTWLYDGDFDWHSPVEDMDRKYLKVVIKDAERMINERKT